MLKKLILPAAFLAALNYGSGKLGNNTQATPAAAAEVSTMWVSAMQFAADSKRDHELALQREKIRQEQEEHEVQYFFCEPGDQRRIKTFVYTPNGFKKYTKQVPESFINNVDPELKHFHAAKNPIQAFIDKDAKSGIVTGFDISIRTNINELAENNGGAVVSKLMGQTSQRNYDKTIGAWEQYKFTRYMDTGYIDEKK